MSKSVEKEILASEYSSEQVLAVNTNRYQYRLEFFVIENVVRWRQIVVVLASFVHSLVLSNGIRWP